MHAHPNNGTSDRGNAAAVPLTPAQSTAFDMQAACVPSTSSQLCKGVARYGNRAQAGSERPIPQLAEGIQTCAPGAKMHVGIIKRLGEHTDACAPKQRHKQPWNR
jgi:hypothetical protein